MSAEAKMEIGTLSVSTSPHIRSEESISKIMWSVNAALAPAALFSVYNFGMSAAVNLVLCIASAVLTEYLILRWQGKDNALAGIREDLELQDSLVKDVMAVAVPLLGA